MSNASKHYRQLIKNTVLEPLSSLGFKLYGKDNICRMTEDGVFQVISFVKSTYGEGDFDIWISIRPMYCPHEDYLTSLPGNDLYRMATNNRHGKYWSYATEAAADESFKEIPVLLNKYALPFFEVTKNCNGIISCYEKNFFGRRKFGSRIEWGTEGWESYDFGHIYLRAGETRKCLAQLRKCCTEFKTDTREWAQTAARECLRIKQLVKAGQPGITKYLEAVIKDSKQKLKLENW